MKICFIGPANSSHIVKWCVWFAQRGHEVHVVSFTQGKIEGAKVHLIDIGVDAGGSDLNKLRYLVSGKRIKKVLVDIKPDVINVHYATSYGAAVALSGIRNYALSVWGADIYDFPRKSILHKSLLKYSLSKASVLLSTSKAMANEAGKYTKKTFQITPFGVDLNLFNPNKRMRVEGDKDYIVGTVKSLSDKYGIKDILHAVSLVYSNTAIPIKLRIAGSGPKEKEYKLLAQTLGIDKITTWLGYISQPQAAYEWANMDLALIPSTLESESFGVSAVEAQASGVPVIISDIPGLMEATSPGATSIVVDRNNPKMLAEQIIRLYNDKQRSLRMGENGRRFVFDNYEMNQCFSHIETILKGISNKSW